MSETMDMISGGAVFATLGVVSLWIMGFTRGTVSLILGSDVTINSKSANLQNVTHQI